MLAFHLRLLSYTSDMQLCLTLSDSVLALAQEGDSVIIDVDADGQVSVLNGDKKMTTALDATPAGIA